MTTEGFSQKLTWEIPQPHSAVTTCTDNRLPIRANGDRIDTTLMTTEGFSQKLTLEFHNRTVPSPPH
jgi:hypothetical protein